MYRGNMFFTKDKLPRKKLDTARLEAIENITHLSCTIDFHLNNRRVGAFLLQRNSKAQPVLVFGFRVDGLHNMLSDEAFEVARQNIVSAFSNMPLGERLTIHFSANQSDAERQRELTALINNNEIHSLNLILASEKKQTRELTKRGLREPKSLYFYATFHCTEVEGMEKPDPVEQGLLLLERTLYSYRGKSSEYEQQRLYDMLVRGFSQGFNVWENLIVTEMGLRAIPLTAEELFANVDKRFNRKPLAELPQKIVVTQDGLTEVVNEETHASSLLFRERGAYIASRSFVKVKDEYLGVLSFVEKPGGWSNAKKQMKYLWNVMAEQEVTNTEIFVEVIRGDSRFAKTTSERFTRQAKVRVKFTEQQNSSSRSSTRTLREADGVMDRLLDGDVPMHVASVFIVRRKTKDLLERACRLTASYFTQPARVLREYDVAWKIFEQTLPLVDTPLLSSPYETKRLTYFASELPGVVPLVNTNVRDTHGVELIEEEGETPIGIDFHSKDHANVLLTGTTRYGKSVLAARLITHVLAKGFNVTVIDYPKLDGSSTFDVFTNVLGASFGSYIDIGSVKYNLFARPQFKDDVDNEMREVRMGDFTAFLASILKAWIVGAGFASHSKMSSVEADLVGIVINAAVADFFKDPAIAARFEAAEAAGMGAKEWNNMPTLRDFPRFCTPNRVKARLALLTIDSEVCLDESLLSRVIGIIQVKLSDLINSKIGRCIANPSSVKEDSRLLVFAFRQIEQQDEAALLALVATSAAYRNSLKSLTSIFFVDEAPILFMFEEVVKCIHRIVANGAKSGIHTVISTQNLSIILRSQVGSDILANLSVRLTGKIQPSAIEEISKSLGYERDIVMRCSNLERNALGGFTTWLLDLNGKLSFVRFYPPPLLLALVANNQDEQKVRQHFFEAIEDRDEAIEHFSKVLYIAMGSGQSLIECASAYLSEHFPHKHPKHNSHKQQNKNNENGKASQWRTGFALEVEAKNE